MSLLPSHLITGSAGGFLGGRTFRHSGETEGRVLHRIRLSRAARRITAVEFWLTGNSSSYVFGVTSSETSTYEFTQDERITRLEFRTHLFGIAGVFTWNNIARVRFYTNRGRLFDFGSSSEPSGQWFGVDVGSGVCVGIGGGEANDGALARLSFVFLRSIQSVAFSSVEYPTISTSTINTTSILEPLPDAFKSNDDDEPLHLVLAGSRQFKTTSTWTTAPAAAALVSHLAGNDITVNVSLGINTPTVVPTGPSGASTTFHWQTLRTFPSSNAIQGSIAQLTVTTDEYSVWCHITDTVAPAQLLPKHAALVGEGRISALRCSARIQVLTDGGYGLPVATFSFPVEVLYDGRAHSNVQIV